VLVLLPPSEGKALGGRGTWAPASGSFGPALAEHRAAVVSALSASLDSPEARGAPGHDGPLVERAAAAVRALAAGSAPVLPAWRRYTGVVWTHLDPATLAPAARRRIVVPSALLGLCRGDDPVPDHRLGFAVSLPGVGRLDRWWRPVATEALRGRRGPVIDLLPTEHGRAVDVDGLHVSFRATDGRRAAGHAAKAVKGTLARAVLEDGLEVLDGFRWSGWRARRRGDEVVVTAPVSR
jgi:cytoplasmic iron level regulating protein YaaA (DUF328/UPF0246 family)